METFWTSWAVTFGIILLAAALYHHMESHWQTLRAVERARLWHRLSRDELRAAINRDYLHRLTWGLIGERIP